MGGSFGNPALQSQASKLIIQCGGSESSSGISRGRIEHETKCTQHVSKLERKLEQLETWMRRNLGYVNLDKSFDNFIFPSPPSPTKSLNTIPTVIIKKEIVSDHEDENSVEIFPEQSDQIRAPASVETSNNATDTLESSSQSVPNGNLQEIASKKPTRGTNISINKENAAPAATVVNEYQPQCQPMQPPSVSWAQSPFGNSQNTPKNYQLEQAKTGTGTLNGGNNQNQNQAVNSPVNRNRPITTVTPMPSPLVLPPSLPLPQNATTNKTPVSQAHAQKSNGMMHLMHPCKSCRKFFPCLQLLQKHVLFAHKKWKCKFCKKAFDQRISMDQHVKDGHSKQRMYQKEKSLGYMTQRYKQQQQQQQPQQQPGQTPQHESFSQSHPQQPQMFPQTHTNPHPHPYPHPDSDPRRRSHHILQQQQQQQSMYQSCVGTVNKSQQQQQQSPNPHFQTNCVSSIPTSASTSTSNSTSTSTSNPCGNSNISGAVLIPVSAPVSTGSISQPQKKGHGNGKANNRTRFEIPNQISQPNVCPVCRKVFSIAEHLAQHMRSHSSHPQPS